MLLVSPVMACLVTVYATVRGRGECAEMEPLLMIRPPCGDCAFMARTAAAAHSMEPVRFTATVASQSARLISSTAAAGPETPALLNRTSTLPQRRRAAAKSRSTSSGTVTSHGTASASGWPSAVSCSCASRRPASATR